MIFHIRLISGEALLADIARDCREVMGRDEERADQFRLSLRKVFIVLLHQSTPSLRLLGP